MIRGVLASVSLIQGMEKVGLLAVKLVLNLELIYIQEQTTLYMQHIQSHDVFKREILIVVNIFVFNVQE